MTSPNPKGLAAYLETDPEEVAGWVEKAPLKLIGAALKDLIFDTDAAGLRSALEKRVLEPAEVEWRDWWKKVQPRLAKSQHFKPGNKKNSYQLAPGVGVEDIPMAALVSRPATSGKDLEQLRESHAADLDKQRESHAAGLRQQRESHAADLERQQKSHAADLQQQRESHAADLKQQRENHAGELKSQEERFNYQIKSLWDSIDSRMEQSRLAVRKDMLLRIGDILQRAYHPTNDPETKLNQVITHLPLALRDGGAELLGEVGETTAFDPTRHHPSREIASGSLVRLTAPGVIITGGEFGELVILKANVTPIAEET